MADQYLLRLPAIEIQQGLRSIYLFGTDGKRLHEFTTVSRIHRDQNDSLHGYQRPEVLAHIRAIRRYLESPGAMLPNALVVAFDNRVRFERARRRSPVDYAAAGDLVIPIDETDDVADKPGWLVDGQQRSAAIRDADIAEFPVAAVGFIAATEEDQRSQFILVNNTRPLPKGLIHELLPETHGELPARYARRRLPAELMIRLNIDDASPFRGLIATPTSPDGYIKDNTVLKMLENSIFEGSLYQYRDPRDGSADIRAMLLHLKIYWLLVSRQWPEAWNLPPRKSRLTHGVGIQALGYLMDALMADEIDEDRDADRIRAKLDCLTGHVAWTSGTWAFGKSDIRRWNGLQNTPNDVRLLTNYLINVSRGS